MDFLMLAVQVYVKNNNKKKLVVLVPGAFQLIHLIRKNIPNA